MEVDNEEGGTFHACKSAITNILWNYAQPVKHKTGF